MKRPVIFLFLSILIIFYSNRSEAQTFPLSGATWIFGRPNSNAYAEKWQYIGDSAIVGGTIKKFNVTTKYTFDSTLVNTIRRNFYYVSDMVGLYVLEPETILCNFSLEPGDSANSPYRLSESQFLGNCSATDTLLFYQKGIVSEKGNEVQDGMGVRYYKLRFLNEWGDSIDVKFNERSLIDSGYWNMVPTQWCGVTFSPLKLICYQDDFTPGPDCPEITWFDLLGNKEIDLDLNIGIYPNPTTDILLINNPVQQYFNVSIMDLQGRVIKNNIQIRGEATFAISLNALSPGIYLLNIVSRNGNVLSKKIIKD